LIDYLEEISMKAAIAAVMAVTLMWNNAASATPYSTAVLADNPIAYWQFEDGNLGDNALGFTAKDSVGAAPSGNHPGIYSLRGNGDGPSLAAGVPGIGGLASHFVRGTTDQNGDYILFDTLGNAASNIDNSGLTFEFWFKNQQTTTTLSRLFGVYNDRPGGALRTQATFGVFETGGTTRVFSRDDSNALQNHRFDASVKNLNDGNWHHIAWILQPGVPAGVSMQVYVDSLLVTFTNSDNSAAQSNFANFDKGFVIGAENQFGTNGVRAFLQDGMLDEFAVYSGVLSAAQVQTHYAAAVPEPATAMTLCLWALTALSIRRGRRSIGR
jgi:hypothetical protein